MLEEMIMRKYMKKKKITNMKTSQRRAAKKKREKMNPTVLPIASRSRKTIMKIKLQTHMKKF